MRVVVTGATGTIGRALVERLDADVTVLSRDVDRAAKALRGVRVVQWDGQSAVSPKVFEGADVVYHFAGESVADGRWTAEKKRRIRDSRELGTKAIVDAIVDAGSRSTLVSASAVGIYGSRGDEILTEASRPGDGFLADVCRVWEHEASGVERGGCRVAMLRIGIVLSKTGGALAKMLPLFRAGIAGRLGRGDQWMPWIHIDDVVGLFLRAGQSADLSGPVNAVSPNPVTNDQFTRALARAVGRRPFLPVPETALRFAFGEVASAVLASQRAVPEKAQHAGYTFHHPRLEEALVDLLPSQEREKAREATA